MTNQTILEYFQKSLPQHLWMNDMGSIYHIDGYLPPYESSFMESTLYNQYIAFTIDAQFGKFTVLFRNGRIISWLMLLDELGKDRFEFTERFKFIFGEDIRQRGYIK